MKNNKYTLFWLTGKTEILEGTTIADAMNNAGYSNGALRALDFYSLGDTTKKYEWNSKDRSWNLIEYDI